MVAAWDLLQLPVLPPDLWETHQQQAREEDAAHAAAMLKRATAWRKGQPPGPLTYPASATEEATSAGDDFDFVDENHAQGTMPPQQHADASEGNVDSSDGAASSVRPRREGARNAGAEDDEDVSASAMVGRPHSAQLARMERNNAVIFGAQRAQGAGEGAPGTGGGQGAEHRSNVAGDDVTMHNILQGLRPEDQSEEGVLEAPALLLESGMRSDGGVLAGSPQRSAGEVTAQTRAGRNNGELFMSAVVKGGEGGL